MSNAAQKRFNPQPPREDAMDRQPCAGGALAGWWSLTDMAFADGQTASHAPDRFRPLKLSGAGPGQYWGGAAGGAAGSGRHAIDACSQPGLGNHIASFNVEN